MILKDLFFLSFLSVFIIFVLNLVGKFTARALIPYKIDAPFYNFFLESMFGFLVLTALYSIFYCGIYTLNIITLLLLVSFFIFKTKNKPSGTPFPIKILPEKKLMIWLGFLSLCCTALSFIIQYNSGIRSDIAFYCKVAETLSVYKRENPFHHFNSHDSTFNGTLTYHYMEMWLGSFFFKLLSWTGYSDLILYKIAIYNALRILVTIGLISFAEKFKKVNVVTICLALIFTIIDFLYISNYKEDSFPLYTNMWTRVNFITYYLFLIAILLHLSDKDYIGAGFFIFFLIVSSITTAPATLMAAGLLLSIIFLYKKSLRKQMLIYLGLAIFFTTIIAVYYKLTGIDSSTLYGGLPLTISYVTEKTLSIWKAIIFFITLLSLKALIAPFVGLLLLSFLGIKEIKKFVNNNLLLLSYFLLIPICGIFIFQMVPYIDNTYQFAYIGYIGCHILLIYVLFYTMGQLHTLYKSKKYFFYAFLLLIIIVGIKFQLPETSPPIRFKDTIEDMYLKEVGMSDNTIKKLKEEFTLKNTLNGGSILDSNFIINNSYARQMLTYQPGFYLMYLQNNTNIVLLTDPAELYPDTDTTNKDYLKTKSFNKYTLFYKNYDYKKQYMDNLTGYINKYNINFLVLSNTYDYRKLTSLPIKKYIRDEGTGTQFLILNDRLSPK